MVAVVVLAISLAVITRSFAHSLFAQHVSLDFFKGGLLLEKKMWELEVTPPVPGKDEGTFDEFANAFRWTVETVENEEIPLYETVVTVGWQSAGRQQSLAVKTYFAKPHEKEKE